MNSTVRYSPTIRRVRKKPRISAIVSIGGTLAGAVLLDKVAPALRALGIDYKILGPPPNFVPNPLDYIASSDLVVTLGGYSTLIEVARYRKRAVVTPLGGDFEQRDNAEVFKGRDGYRVIPLNEVNEELLQRYVKEVLEETPDPPRFTDGAREIASRIRELAEDQA